MGVHGLAYSDVRVFDSAGGNWPKGAAYILAYCDSWGGRYRGRHYATNVELAKAKFPKARIIQIAVMPPATGVVVAGYDVENGALTVYEACGIVNHDVVRLGRRPFIYCAQSTVDYVQWMMQRDYRQVVGRYDLWLADPDGDPAIPPGFIAKQFSWPDQHPIVPGQIYDISSLRSDAACLHVGDAAA